MIKFIAKIDNQENAHSVTVKTGDKEHSIDIAPKAGGFGSSINGAEALLFALATCYCNDIYREAKNEGITVKHVSIEVEGDYDGQAGHIIENIVYHVTVDADASQAKIENLIKNADTLAEIQNTLRRGTSVKLGQITATQIS